MPYHVLLTVTVIGLEMTLDYGPLSDEQLVVLLARRDSDALAALYDRHAHRVMGMAMLLLREQDAAEEVVQDIFLKVWRQPESYDASRGRFSSWLLSITHNRAVDILRSRHANLISADDPDTMALVLAEASDATDPGDEAGLAEERQAVRQALSELPEAQRQVIELAYFRGMSQREIAAHLKEPLGTVKTRMRLAMQKLRSRLIGLRMEEVA